ncbi:MAG: hypothetical protein IGQ88_07045 [Gloeomargaritaceae cyanobacterium C42_A2020_066]|nr:hypothetical protein [Gloeomargaritaceae cyanobacterium C42_A2020_066]
MGLGQGRRTLAGWGLVAALVGGGAAGAVAPLGQPQEQATGVARQAQRQKEQARIRPAAFDLARFPLTEAHETHWRRLLWAVTVLNPPDAYIPPALEQILAQAGRPQPTAVETRVITQTLQLVHQWLSRNPQGYPELVAGLRGIVATSPHPRWVALASLTLVRSGQAAPRQLQATIQQRFPTPTGLLEVTLREVLAPAANAPVTPPPLADLLRWSVAPGEPHLYVFCRPDRWVLCQAILKDRQGQFVTTAGRLWSVPLLTQSIYGLDWAFTYGQTPQGLYRLEGLTPPREAALFRAYGQFPMVKLFLPFEAGVQAFLPGRPGPLTGSLADYEVLVPPTWRGYRPLHQSYWAGRLGRGLLRIHGMGDDPSFFSRPAEAATQAWNPALGCLTALEAYDAQGNLQDAHMPILLDALRQVGGDTGYVWVVEVPPAPGEAGRPVSLETLAAAVGQAQLAQTPGR